jgi:hypothetical protein
MQEGMVQAELSVLHLHWKSACGRLACRAARMRVLKPIPSDTPTPTGSYLLLVSLPRPSIYKPSHSILVEACPLQMYLQFHKMEPSMGEVLCHFTLHSFCGELHIRFDSLTSGPSGSQTFLLASIWSTIKQLMGFGAYRNMARQPTPTKLKVHFGMRTFYAYIYWIIQYAWIYVNL